MLIEHLRLLAAKGGTVVLDRPLLEVAENLGLTHEAYYRALAALARTRAIKRTSRKIAVLRSAAPQS